MLEIAAVSMLRLGSELMFGTIYFLRNNAHSLELTRLSCKEING